VLAGCILFIGKTNAYETVVGKPHGKRKFWRAGHKGEDNLKFVAKKWAVNM
jgi:hypothetical protein